MYGKEVRSKELLDGRVPPPDEAHCLYAALKEHVEGMLLDAASEGVRCGIVILLCFQALFHGFTPGGNSSFSFSFSFSSNMSTLIGFQSNVQYNLKQFAPSFVNDFL